MSYAPIVSTSYTEKEGTYTLEVLQQDAAEANNDLLLIEKPRRRGSARDRPLMGIKEQEVRIRVRDKGRLLTDKVLNGAELKLRLQGPDGWEGPINNLDGGREMTTNKPVIDLLFSGGIDRLEGLPYDLTGKKTIAEAFHGLLAPTDGPGTVRVAFGWQHSEQGTSRHPARNIRMPMDQVQFGDADSQGYLDVLTNLLAFWNCELLQSQNRWLVRHRSEIGGNTDMLDYDGSSYSTATANWDAAVGKSDFVRFLNDEKLELKRPIVPGLGAAESRYEYDRSPLANTSFTDWDNGDPVGWDVAGSVTEQNGEARISNISDHLEQAAFQPYTALLKDKNVIEITFSYKIASDASTEDYELIFAVPHLDGAEDGDQRYVHEDGSLSAVEKKWYVSFTVTSQNQGSTVYETVTVTPDDPSSTEYGSPRLLLTFEPNVVIDGNRYSTSDVDWIQFDKAVWDIQYTSTPKIAFIHTGLGDGAQRVDMQASLGDRDLWNPTHGVIEYYDGSTWRPASRGWTTSLVTNDGSLHFVRVYDLLRQRKRRVSGLDARFNRWTISELATIPSFGSTLHPATEIDGQWGAGATRLVAYEQRSFPVDTTDIYSESVYEEQ
jgi:hypothetical protein